MGQNQNQLNTKIFFELSKNENTSYPNLWNTMKLEEARSQYCLSEKKKSSHICNLAAHLNSLENKLINTPKG